jgi:hypothetical protein
MIIACLPKDELNNHGGHFAQLVCGKARQFLDEYADLLVSPTWALSLSDRRLAACDQEWLGHSAVSLCLTHVAGLKARIVDQCETFPGVVLQLAYPGYSTPHPPRAMLAYRLLNTLDDDLGATTRKIKHNFAEDFTIADNRVSWV